MHIPQSHICQHTGLSVSLQFRGSPAGTVAEACQKAFQAPAAVSPVYLSLPASY